jgi:CheY-like chemotaxis protein
MARVRMRPRVLIAEDDQAVAKSVLRALAGVGEHIVVETASALAEALSSRWDAVVLDIHLRGGNGIEVLERARSQKCRSPVIVLTGDYRKSNQDVAERLGIEVFLSKGVDDDIDRATADNLLFRVASCLLRD